jgi:hypothetical protein
MLSVVDTGDISAVQSEVQFIFTSLFPQGDSGFIVRSFGWYEQLFRGKYPGFQAIDARYHDFEHTLQGTLCLARLLRGRHIAGIQPLLTPRIFELGLLAILMHDTGYLKRSDDLKGTGAKYTLTHVRRSVEFAQIFLSEKGFSTEDIHAVQNMIRCTGVNVDLNTIPFASECEKVTGFALGTSDLLGQMAAADYVDKLPTLYLEFKEASEFKETDVTPTVVFQSADDLIRKTPGFWKGYVWPKMNQDFEGLYQFLADPYPDGPNAYLHAIEVNLARLSRLSATEK